MQDTFNAYIEKGNINNLVFLGDSISKGVIYDQVKNKYVKLSDCFVNIIEKQLKGAVINAGKFGNTVIRACKHFSKDVIDKKPNIAIIEFGGNDCDFNWVEVAANPKIEHIPNTNINEFKIKLQEMILVLRKNSIVPIFMTLPPIDSYKYLNWISQGSDSNKKNILSWLGETEKIYYWQEMYNSAVLQTAVNTNTQIIDVRSAFLVNKSFRSLLCHDGIHPNKEGHKIIADTIINFFVNNYSALLNA